MRARKRERERENMSGSTTTNRPSQYYIDERWDAAIDSTLRHVVYGSVAGGVAALLFFRKCRGVVVVLDIFLVSRVCFYVSGGMLGVLLGLHVNVYQGCVRGEYHEQQVA